MKYQVACLTISTLILTGCNFSTPAQPSPSSTPTSDPVVTTMPEADAVSSTPTSSANNQLRDRLITNITLTVPETDELISFGGEQGDWSAGYVLIGQPVAQLPDQAMAAILNVNAGGNARDVYLAVFELGEASWQMTDAVLLGDYSSNADVTQLSTDMETIYVTYLTLPEDASAQAEQKTVENNQTFTYLDGKLTEVE